MQYSKGRTGLSNLKLVCSSLLAAVPVGMGATSTANAQTVPQVSGIDPQIPLLETCPLSSGPNFSQCTTPVIGTRTTTTITPTTATAIPTNQGGGTIFRGSQQVNFDGKLQVEGVRLQFNGTAASNFVGDGFAKTTVDLTTEYVQNFDVTVRNGIFVANPGFAYSVGNTTVRSINLDLPDGSDFGEDGVDYTLSTVDPTAVVNNSVQLTGTFQSDEESGGPLFFGTLTGTATLKTGTLTSDFTDPDDQFGAYLSPYALDVDVTPTIDTYVGRDGIIAPTISVKNGINLNGSRVTNVGNGVNPGDAVNKGQLDAAIASVITIGPNGNSVEIGNSTVMGGKAVAIGDQNIANGDGAVAIGDPNVANGLGAVAIGADNTATGQAAIAIGNLSVATGQSAVALGDTANASQAGNIAIGQTATATGATSTAVGNLAQATDEDAVALGDRANASGFHSTAVGGEAVATGRGAQSFGWQSRATGNLSGAFGHQANAAGVQATALGKNANAAQANATAVGFGATTTRANQVMLGGTGSSVTVGDVAASTAAQVGPTDIVTVDASGTIGRDTTLRPAIAAAQAVAGQVSAIQVLDAQQQTRLGALEAGQNTLGARLETQNRSANAGIAAAMAMGGTILPADAKYAISFNLATYRGQQGFSGSAVFRVSEKVYFNAGVAGSTVRGSTGGRAGVTFAW